MSALYTNTGAAPTPAPAPKPANIREEARAAILGEQLSYLLRHTGACGHDCADCARLRKVEEALLEPFGVKLYHRF